MAPTASPTPVPSRAPLSQARTLTQPQLGRGLRIRDWVGHKPGHKPGHRLALGGQLGTRSMPLKFFPEGYPEDTRSSNWLTSDLFVFSDYF